MEKIYINDPNAVLLSVKTLKGGGVVMHPTETCYGFAVDIFNEDALKKLYELKWRGFNKPVSILVDGFGMAGEYGLFSKKAVSLVQKYWPGPLSILVPRKKILPDFFNSAEDFVSIRFSSDSFCTAMVEALGGPVTTTSANISGMEPLYEADLKQFGDFVEKIDLLIDGGRISKNKPSTIVKVEGDRIEVLRQGNINLRNL